MDDDELIASLRHPPPERLAVNIELTDVTRTFGRNKAVDGVSLAVGPGVFGLLGPNGAGKTSLLRMLATVLPPSSGTVRLLDGDPSGPAARTEIRRRLGYLPQNLGYYPSFTVAEFVEYFALLKEMPAHEVPNAVAAAVDELTAQGEGHVVGDSPLERGHSAVLAASRKQVAA